MKLISIYENPQLGEKRFFPRDIRNYIASITQNDKEIHDEIMGHERKQPTFIFSMPNRKSFGIYTFKKDRKTKKMMETIRQRIAENKDIRIAGGSAVVKKAFTANYEFTRFENGIQERTFKTPMVIGSSKVECELAKSLTRDENNIDYVGLEKMVRETIAESIRFQTRDWFGEEVIADDLIILFKDLKYVVVRYNDKQTFPAVLGTVICNRELPLFLGYKSGMGYGELMSMNQISKIKRRNK